MARRDVEHNAGQILKYLEELLPELEPRGGIPENPMNRKERGVSRPPVSPYVMELWEANPQLDDINWILSQAARSTEDVEIEGRAMWKILGDCLWDHTAIRNWKAWGGIFERRLWDMCRLLAQRLAIRKDTDRGPYRLYVHTKPENVQLRQKTREAQKRDTAYTDRLIVRRVQSLEAEGMGREEAKKHLAHDPNVEWGYERIRWAIKETNRRDRENDIKNAS